MEQDDAACKVSKRKPLADVKPRQLTRRTEEIWNLVKQSATAEDVVTVLTKVLEKAEEEWPGSFKSLAQQYQKVLDQPLDCGRCCNLLKGLSGLPAFQSSTKLPNLNRAVQHQMDCVVRNEVESREEACRLGYPMGDKRWIKAGNPEETINPGGRPSQVDSADVVKSVQAALDRHSQPSSAVCQKGDNWSVVNTLTDKATAVYQSEDSMFGNMSISTFRRVLRKHLTEYKRPRTLTDYCQHCADLEDSVLPEARKALDHWTKSLAAIMTNYWVPWETYVSSTSLSFDEQPGLYLSQFEHYINMHSRQHPCAKHRDSNFPCGQHASRRRGAPGFAQARRIELHETEAAAGHELRAHLKLLMGYLHHRSAKEAQHTAITALLETPPLGTAVLLSDWKELETLPQCWKQTGDQFFAQARHEVSIWGALLIEHDDASTVAVPVLIRTHFVVVSKILDHTALRTNQLIQIALQQKKSSKPWQRLALVSDCGPHYRSLESLAHGLVALHRSYKIPIEIHFGCEKHMKSAIDRLFGWVKAILRRHRERRKDLLEVKDLVLALRSGFAENKANNPQAPTVLVGLDESPVPTTSIVLVVKDFKISRTYCLSCTPSKLRPDEPRIWDHTFSSKPASVEVEYTLASGSLPSTWRTGFWSHASAAWKERPKPLEPNEESTLTRRYLAQKHLLPNTLERRRQLLPDFEEQARKRQKRLQKAREAARARKSVLQSKRRGSSSSSTSSSSSSSSKS